VVLSLMLVRAYRQRRRGACWRVDTSVRG